MSTQIAVIRENSEQFLPAFAMVEGVGAGQTARYAPLEFRYDDRGPLPAESETILERWLAYGSGLFTATSAGQPLSPETGTTGNPIRLFEGPFDVLLTERRILIYVFGGSTVLGKVGGRTSNFLIAVYPLERIDCVDIATKSGFSGPKERALKIMTLTGTAAAIVLDDVQMVWDRGRFAKFGGSKRADILERLVPLVVAARRPLATGADSEQLDLVLAGARTSNPGEIGVQFVAA